MPFARTLAAATAVAVFAMLATAAPASAHDELVYSNPAADARLESAPEAVTMTFSGELLTLGDSMTGATVLVVDADGNEWTSGDPEVVANTVTVPLADGMQDAGYQVRWQVVSEDGHPISGVTRFTIGDAEPFLNATAPQTDDTGSEPDQTSTETSDALRVVLVGIGGAALAAAAFALYRFLRRPRTAPAPSHSDAKAESEL